MSTAAEAPPTTSKPSTELEATQRHADSTQQSNVTQPCTTTCDEQQSAEKQPRKHQHSEKLKQRKRKKRYVGIPLLVLAVVVVIFAIGLPKAAKVSNAAELPRTRSGGVPGFGVKWPFLYACMACQPYCVANIALRLFNCK